MIDAFLDRLGETRPVRPDLASLRNLHRAWRERVPYENLDVQLGRPVRLDPEALVDKIVVRGRGGYCYEQNGALALLLEAVGFEVTMVEAGVMREQRGDGQWGNHNALLVTIGGETWLADAGIGDGFLEPLPLRELACDQDGLVYRIERLDRTTWRVHHHPGGTISSYDLRTEARELSDFAARSRELTTSPSSPYVTTLMAARPAGGATALLLSRTVRHLGVTRGEPRTLAGRDEFADLLARDFLVPLDDLGESGVDELWEAAGRQDDLWRTRIRG